MLPEFSIIYITQKVVKGCALANFLINQPIKDYDSMQCKFPTKDIMALYSKDESPKDQEWTLLFDGVSNAL